MDERQWQLSQDLISDPRIEEAIAKVSSMIRTKGGYMVSEIENSAFRTIDHEYSDYRATRFTGLITSRSFASLPHDLQAESVKGFVNETGDWKYGLEADDDGLFPGQKASRTAPSQLSDGLVLSGLAGSELMKKRSLDALVRRDGDSDLSVAIRLGGIGLVAAQGVWDVAERGNAASYVKEDDAHFSHVTRVSGTFHGDYIMGRRDVFRGHVIDPLMRPQDFGPAFPETRAYAYHSIEPELMADVVRHAVLAGLDLKAFRNRVAVKWNAKGAQRSYAGPFGDFGSDDGEMSAEILKRWLANDNIGDGSNVLLSRVPVMAGEDGYMSVTSRADGLYLHNDGHEDGVLIKTDELEDFALALLEQTRQGLGRTSTDALVHVLDAIE